MTPQETTLYQFSGPFPNTFQGTHSPFRVKTRETFPRDWIFGRRGMILQIISRGFPWFDEAWRLSWTVCKSCKRLQTSSSGFQPQPWWNSIVRMKERILPVLISSGSTAWVLLPFCVSGIRVSSMRSTWPYWGISEMKLSKKERCKLIQYDRLIGDVVAYSNDVVYRKTNWGIPE